MKGSVRRRSSHFWRSIATLQTHAARAIFTPLDHFYTQVESSCKNLALHFLSLSCRLQASMCPSLILFSKPSPTLNSVTLWMNRPLHWWWNSQRSAVRHAARKGHTEPGHPAGHCNLAASPHAADAMTRGYHTTVVRARGSRLTRKRDSLSIDGGNPSRPCGV